MASTWGGAGNALGIGIFAASSSSRTNPRTDVGTLDRRALIAGVLGAVAIEREIESRSKRYGSENRREGDEIRWSEGLLEIMKSSQTGAIAGRRQVLTDSSCFHHSLVAWAETQRVISGEYNGAHKNSG